MSGAPFQMLLAGGLRQIKHLFTDNRNGATSYANVNLGPDDPSRIIVVAFSTGNPLPSGMTLDGLAMNLRVSATRSQIYTRAYPSGTLKTIALVGAGGSVDGIGVYALYGANTEAPDATLAVPGGVSGTIHEYERGAAIGCFGNNNGASFSGWNGLTQDYANNASLTIETSASGEFTTDNPSAAVSVTAPSGAFVGLSVASWKPAP